MTNSDPTVGKEPLGLGAPWGGQVAPQSQGLHPGLMCAGASLACAGPPPSPGQVQLEILRKVPLHVCRAAFSVDTFPFLWFLRPCSFLGAQKQQSQALRWKGRRALNSDCGVEAVIRGPAGQPGGKNGRCPAMALTVSPRLLCSWQSQVPGKA